MKECVHCGAENPDDAEFCSLCYGNLTGPGAETLQTSPPETSSYTQPPPVYPGGLTYNPYHYPQQPVVIARSVSNNGKALASLVLGIFGIASCPIIASVIAIILGMQARREIAASGGWETGESLAKAGIITGWVGIALFGILIIVVAIAAAIQSGTTL